MELFVNSKTPPAFVFCAQDDDVVPAINSVRYFDALRKNNVSSELHVFSHGGHGFGIGKGIKTTAKNWSSICEKWLKEKGLI